MYICLCNGITDRTIRETVRGGVSSVQELSAKTGCGTCCGSCLPIAEEIIQLEQGRSAQRSPAENGRLRIENLVFA